MTFKSSYDNGPNWDKGTLNLDKMKGWASMLLSEPHYNMWDEAAYDWLGISREAKPTHEELVERAEQIGLVLCKCSCDGGQVIVYNPKCEVHNELDRLSSRRDK